MADDEPLGLNPVDRETAPERHRDLERILTFIDAIAAVAITLLVLPLVDLAGEIESSDDPVGQLLRDNVDKFGAFALSFAVIARLWFAQHVIVQSLIRANTRISVLLVLWSAAIVFLPFPTALVPEAGTQAAAKVLYVGTLMVSALLLCCLALEIGRDRSLRDTDAKPRISPTLVTGLLFAVALAIMLAIPRLGFWPLFLLFLSGPLISAWGTRSRR